MMMAADKGHGGVVKKLLGARADVEILNEVRTLLIVTKT